VRGAGCGVREGIGADAPMIFYWEYTQASLKYPYKSKKMDHLHEPIFSFLINMKCILYKHIEDFCHLRQFSSVDFSITVSLHYFQI